MSDDIKQAIDSFAVAFEEFKSTNNERLAEIEKKGEADPLVDEKLKKQYRVLGLPTVIVLTPSGEVAEQYRGYTQGQKKPYIQRLKDRILTEKHNEKIWRKGMKAKGYRVWTGRNGQQLFARLTRYRNGDIVLVEPDGRKSKTSELQLSKKDRDWLDKQRARRP